MHLAIDAGFFTSAGKRDHNEDFGGFVAPGLRELALKGWIGAVADGVSGSSGGREAAEYCVRGLFNDYYATPDTWDVQQSIERVVAAINRWIYERGQNSAEKTGASTTLTALVLRGAYYYFAHAGDSRLYRLRDGKLDKLTTDHVWDRPELSHVLTRAVGLDRSVLLDHGSGLLHKGDVFLLCSDGVHQRLKQYDLEFSLKRVAEGGSAEACATALCDEAIDAGANDNVTAVVAHVRELPQQELADTLRMRRDLDPPPVLDVDQQIDGLIVEERLVDSRASMVYRVRDTKSGAQRVLKTLHPSAASDAMMRLALAHEEWLSRRATAKFFPQVVEPPQAPSRLYFLLEWIDGITLAQRAASGHRTTVPECLQLGAQLLRAIGALHRRGIVHRDLKPENLHLGLDGVLRVLDLGVAQSGFEVPSLHDAARAGTPSYLAPEQFTGGTANPQTDLYAAGVTLYHLLSARYPYGEIEPFQTPAFGTPAPITRWRPDVPRWLEIWLQKATAANPAQRFETAEEMLLALERGPLAAVNATPPRHAAPLAVRYPRALLIVLLGASLVLNAVLLWRMFGK